MSRHLRSSKPQVSSSRVPEQQTVEEEASSEEPESEPASPNKPKPHTPRKQAEIASSIATSTQKNLRAVDSGICFITRQTEPKIAIQACRILRRTPEKIIYISQSSSLVYYKDMWKLEEINIDSTVNLVSLRADWHASYDSNCWAFVPSPKILEKMEKYGTKGTFLKPYAGYKMGADIDYNFVAFPTLGLEFIARDNDNNTNAIIFTHDPDYPEFPLLRHHSHPYLVIANALLKFREHKGSLTDAQIHIFCALMNIEDLWKNRRSPARASIKLPGRKRRMGDPDKGPSDEVDGGGPSKRKGKGKEKESRAKSSMAPLAPPPTAGKGKGHQLKDDFVETLIRPPQLYPSPPITIPCKDSNDVGSCFQKTASIMTWIAGVLSNGEVCREPFIGDWHKWCYPWTQPPENSKYSSNDWAMQRCMCKLTAEPGGWDFSQDEDVSDDSDHEHYTSLSS